MILMVFIDSRMGSICNKVEMAIVQVPTVLTSRDYIRLSKLNLTQKRIIQEGWQILKQYLANIGINFFIGWVLFIYIQTNINETGTSRG